MQPRLEFFSSLSLIPAYKQLVIDSNGVHCVDKLSLGTNNTLGDWFVVAVFQSLAKLDPTPQLERENEF